jgi:hypothetical protein
MLLSPRQHQALPKPECILLSEIGGESVNTASLKREILESLKDREYRDAFKEENVFTSICFQIRALREQREKSQKELGRLVIPMMAPERISILEDPNAETKPTVATLLRLQMLLMLALISGLFPSLRS